MSGLKQEAVQMIENMQEDKMIQVIAFLKDIEVKGREDRQEEAMRGFETLMEFAGTLPEDLDHEQELAEAREEKYGRID